MFIIVADDVKLNRRIISRLLAPYDIFVEEADDGKQALELYLSAEPGYYSLILMDLNMPVMDGYTASAAIRGSERPDAGTLPIIAYTTERSEESRARCRECGMNRNNKQAGKRESFSRYDRGALRRLKQYKKQAERH